MSLEYFIQICLSVQHNVFVCISRSLSLGLVLLAHPKCMCLSSSLPNSPSLSPSLPNSLSVCLSPSLPNSHPLFFYSCLSPSLQNSPSLSLSVSLPPKLSFSCSLSLLLCLRLSLFFSTRVQGRVHSLEAEAEQDRRLGLQLELLKKDKTRLLSQLTAQESVIDGLRAERKIWGQELAQQGRGRPLQGSTKRGATERGPGPVQGPVNSHFWTVKC